jgi:hypothetical protein
MKALKKALKFALGLAAFFLLYLAYGMYQEPRAETKAKAFCASVKVGDATDPLVERALAEGSEPAFTKWRQVAPDERQLMVIFVGLPPFSRHICDIRAASRVLHAQYRHLD